MNKAQGAMEYLLVIVAVVLVAAVVITSLPYFLDKPQGKLPALEDALNSLRGGTGTSGISIVEAEINPNDNSGPILTLNSNNAQPLNVTNVLIGGSSVSFTSSHSSGGGGGTTTVVVQNPIPVCSCAGKAIGEIVTCDLNVNYLVNGEVNFQIFSQAFTCADTSSTLNTIVTPGNGNQEDPYLILTCEGLQNIDNNLSANYELFLNLDCSDTRNWNSGAGFEPLGTNTAPFTGYLNGKNKSITGLYIYRPSTENVGLFGYAQRNNLVVNDLTLVDANVTGLDFVGAFFGTLVGSDASYDNLSFDGEFVSVWATSASATFAGGGGLFNGAVSPQGFNWYGLPATNGPGPEPFGTVNAEWGSFS